MVGPGPVKGFLDSLQIVNLALRIGADAIHPGYGFLSENPHFAQLCHTSGITFIGPSPQAIDLMGSKVKARELAKRVGIPIVPGTEGGVTKVTEIPGTRSSLKPVQAEEDAVFGWCGRMLNCVRTWRWRHERPRLPSAMGASFSKSISSDHIISNSKSSPTGMATSFTSVSAIARYSAGIKSSSRLLHP
jgi:Biotin carboxylase, N-terminal domain